jgi:hypothetical protein
MEITWKCILTNNELTQLYVLQDLLEQNDIAAIVMNKNDSSYPSIGEGELYVDASKAEAALLLIEKVNAGEISLDDEALNEEE